MPANAAGTCGTGTWKPGNLEIHHINVGQGDSALIVGPTGRALLFDAGEDIWNSNSNAKQIGAYIQGVLGCKSLDYAIISHFHHDHVGYVGYGGLWHLVEAQGFTVGKTLVRNYQSYLGNSSGTFTSWRSYLEGAGQSKLHPVTVVEGTGQVDLGTGVTFNIVATDGNGSLAAGDFHNDANPPSENDYSVGAVLSFGKFDEWIGGDLSGEYDLGSTGYSYHDIEISVAPEVGDVDVYKVNHHASERSSSLVFVNQLDPEVSIMTVGNSNDYGYPTQVTMDRLLATSAVYLTERGDTGTNIGSAVVAGNIVIKTSDGTTYTVNGKSFTATEPARIDADGDGYFWEADPLDTSASSIPYPNGGCDPTYQNCAGTLPSCLATPGQVVINEFLPAASSVVNNSIEWVELYNTTDSAVNIGYCFIDDSAGGSAPYQIPPFTRIPARGFWTLDRTSYFTNTGDQVRFLKEDASTVLDSYSYGNTSYDLSWYRLPDAGSWSASPTSFTTKRESNTLPFYPIVVSSSRTDENPSTADSLNFTVTFSKPVMGVDTTPPFNNFSLHTTGVTGAFISAVSGSGTTYTVTVKTGSDDGTIRLDVVDDDSIVDAMSHPLGGSGAGNGDFTRGEVYTLTRTMFPLPDIWVGGVAISSDKNVVTVGRPHVGAEVASYDGFSSGSLSAYVPMLFRKAYGIYNSALYVQNVNASNTASITVKYYDSNGELKCTRNDTVAPLSSKGYWLPTETCNTGSLLDGWVGGAVVTSDQPIVAVGRPHVGSEVMTYNGFPAGDLTSYIPMLFKGAYGGSYNSAFYIQNVHASNNANITIKYYDSEGNLKCTKADQISSLASKGYWVPTATCDTGSLPAGWVGGVVVTSDQPIVGVGRPHIGTQVTTYDGFTAGSANSYVPMLFKNAWGSYNSAFYVQNTHASNTANVTIQYYSDTGILNCTKADTLAPLATRGYWVPSANCDTGSLPDGWVGGVVVTSDQPIVGVGRPHIGTQVTTYNGFTAGDSSSYVPMLFKKAFGGSYDSAFYIQNTENSDATVTIKLYDTNGSLTCTRTDTVAPLSTLGFWVPSVYCIP